METTAIVPDLYDLTNRLHHLWNQGVERYRGGKTTPGDFFTESETTELQGIGLGVMDVFDYVEDFVSSGDPDVGTFLLVSFERVLFFFEDQGGEPSSEWISEASLPPREETVAGIPWLPRILVKANAKLRGQLPGEVMYGCGGDRRFLRSCGIHPAEFLRKVKSSSDEDVVSWVVSRLGNREK
ncbi:MAG: DUF5069 domain-containing protein [Verrucomicrobiota bacterium]